MSTSKAKLENLISITRKYLPSLPEAHGKRVSCLGGCGKEVTADMGECKHCRRSRIHKGLKRVKKARK